MCVCVCDLWYVCESVCVCERVCVCVSSICSGRCECVYVTCGMCSERCV